MMSTAVIKEMPYWLDPAPLASGFTEKALPERTRVLIIGGGVTGMAAAIHLRRGGADVTLVDRERFCTTASGRNGGMALPGLKESIGAVYKRFGRDLCRRFFAASLESVDCVEDLVREGGIDCAFRRCGSLTAAYKPAHYEGLKKEQALLAQVLDYKTHLVPPAQMPAELGSTFYSGGLVDPQGAGVHPARYVAGLVRMADQAGADLHEGVAARAVERRQSGFAVRTDKGTVKAEHVLVATNGYTDAVFPWARRRIIPIESLMIATEKLPQALASELIPGDRMVFDTKYVLFYFRLSPDGRRVLFGGRTKTAVKDVAERARFMQAAMNGVFPQLKPYRVAYAWSGYTGFTFDKYPHIGVKDGIHYAMGYCGHGVAMGTYFGKAAAEWILGRGRRTVFAAKAFPTMPLYRGNPWFVPLVTEGFKVLDRIV